MKRFFTILCSLVCMVMVSCTSETLVTDSGIAYSINDGVIVTEVPQRPVGQTDVLQLTCEPIPVVRVGFIGLGMRGPGAVKRFTKIPGVEIKALCDYEPDRAAKAQKILTDAGLPDATLYSGPDGWQELCNRKDLDLVYIATDWKNHAKMGVYAMEHGKHVAIEVPSAMNLKEIWDLVNTSEKTRKHCMQLENCVYDFFELTSLNMAQHGLFGEVLHVEGSYIHNLVDFWGSYWNNWRLNYNREHRGDNYPTHGIGPVCQVLNIHRGDKMNYVVSMDTKAVGYKEVVKKLEGEDADDFQCGDHTVSLIRTEKGKTIEIQHNVVNPRPYSRMYQLTGTKGFANKYPIQGFTLDTKDNAALEDNKDFENLNAHGFVPKEVKDKLMQDYKHPIHIKLEEMAKKVGGHGGMDFVMDYRLIYCLQNGLPLDMDVYDLAEWCCLTELSGLSIKNHSKPVQVPDFTRGNWNKLDGLHFAE